MKLIFPHIPKTGGRSLYVLFKRKYGKRCRHITIGENNLRLPDEIILSTDFECYYGHFNLHRLPGCAYVIVLRHPVDRLVSYYKFLTDKKLVTGSFRNYLKTMDTDIRNGAACRIQSVRPHNVDLKTCINILDTAEFVSVTEHLGDLAKALDLPGPIPRLNKSESDFVPTQEDIDFVLSMNEVDLALYQKASEKSI